MIVGFKEKLATKLVKVARLAGWPDWGGRYVSARAYYTNLSSGALPEMESL